ncbi:predicted protein [Sclerotinia sclerotiorum 1980 UF-70]|uniref:Uncharacterized protein n=1 Tax=Sclerotinia sclerotiorum (strain ATCC 18683 / 1980 / Ss-1) TaxID=665079 RepID=A7E8D3_SCLS1|nr:predicted protein [Sclerotinia sclerotiorum 1980 UF-70]EDN96635.1 predicted protein [Sclerotinia sclerotiorum 1980 UF-70]
MAEQPRVKSAGEYAERLPDTLFDSQSLKEKESWSKNVSPRLSEGHVEKI